MNNLDIYNKYRAVPEGALKDFDNGTFKGTDINTMWRIKVLTDEFGPVGKGWYIETKRLWEEAAANDELFVFAEINLYVKYDEEWSKPIYGVGGNKLIKYIKTQSALKGSDEAYKMAITDAFGNACKYLGIGADVYWENDKTKYTQPSKADDRKQVIEVIKGDMPSETLKEIARKHNCLSFSKATDEDFAAFVKEIKEWKS